MPLPDSNLSTLQQIVIKVRRLTQSLSPNILSDQSIYDYVNTFVLYDFPEHLRLFNLRTTVTWYCEPYISEYDTNQIGNPNDPLYNFLNIYTTVHPPVYIAGYQSLFSQSPEQFYAIYPQLSQISLIGYGNGIKTNFVGILPSSYPPNIPIPPNYNTVQPVEQGNIVFSSIDVNYNGLTLIDAPLPGIAENGGITTPLGGNNGTINYITGAYNINFNTPPAANAKINVQVVPYQPARPAAILFYDGIFTLRPIPDQPYQINLEVYQRPSAMLSLNSSPLLAEWWQYIAYGAAKKVFEDRMDMDSVQLIMPEFNKQQRLILRRTIVQNTNNRTSTIYTEQNTSGGNGWGNNATGLI